MNLSYWTQEFLTPAYLSDIYILLLQHDSFTFKNLFINEFDKRGSIAELVARPLTVPKVRGSNLDND
jgi:hypothetical protein